MAGITVKTNDGKNVTLRSEEHTSELQSLRHLVCRLLLEKKKKTKNRTVTNQAANPKAKAVIRNQAHRQTADAGHPNNSTAREQRYKSADITDSDRRHDD